VLKVGDTDDRLGGVIVSASAVLNTSPFGPLCDSSLGRNIVRLEYLNLPWHLVLEGFTGQLPSIDQLIFRWVGYSHRMTLNPLGGTTCTYGGDLTLISNSNSFEGINELTIGTESLARTGSGGPFGFLCPSTTRLTEEDLALARSIPIELI
jgi:hypothetical protein